MVAPEYDTIISITDKDLSTGIRFLVSTATIIEEMTRDFVSNPAAEVNYAHYQKNIKRYEPTFMAILEDFEDSIFG